MYPVTYEADYLRERNRLTTFFRLIVAIPWLIVGFLYQLAALVAVLVAWFALILLGRYPDGLYGFVGGVLRFYMRVTGFVTLQTDDWPPFGLSDDRWYPIRIGFDPPADRQSRLKALFRLFLSIPLLVMSYFFGLLQQAVALIAWMTIVFRGYQPAGVHNALAYTNSWITRAYAYMLLMRDEYPSVGDESVNGGSAGQELPPGDRPEQTPSAQGRPTAVLSEPDAPDRGAGAGDKRDGEFIARPPGPQRPHPGGPGTPGSSGNPDSP